MFIYDPAILFQGVVIDTIENVITGTIGLLVFAAFFEGFFVRPMNWFERITFVVLAFLLFWPETISNIIGLLGLAVVRFYLRKTKKKIRIFKVEKFCTLNLLLELIFARR